MTLAVLAAFALSPAALADDKDNQKKPDPKQIEAAYKQFATPGKEHQQFKRLVGRWNAEILMYEDPSKPQKSKGTATIRLLLGGRYMQQNFRGSFGGQKFEGQGLTGFNNATKKYVGTWIDSMGTGISTTEGTYDRKTNTMTEMMVSSTPMGQMKMRNVTKYITNDRFLFTMFAVTPAGEQKVMEISYTRAKRKGKKKNK